MSILLKKFAEFKNCERIWAIGSIHGNLQGIKNIHNHIFSEFNPSDQIVYLGNVIGVVLQYTDVLDEVINFRLKTMAKYNIEPEKIIYLRGSQEEMWSKLLELQISPNPKEVLLWMFSHGVDKTLQSYNFQKDEKHIFDHILSFKTISGDFDKNTLCF